MSNYSSLKATIDTNIKQNGVQAITGQILNSVLKDMVDSMVGQDLIKSTPRGYYVDKNHVVSIASGGAFEGYVTDTRYDVAWLTIPLNAASLSIIGATRTRYVYFRSAEVSSTSFLGTNITGSIPSGAVLCLVNLTHTSNPDGYDNMIFSFSNAMGDQIATLKTFESNVTESLIRAANMQKASLAETYPSIFTGNPMVNSAISATGIVSSTLYDIKVYEITPGNVYSFTARQPGGYNRPLIAYISASGGIISVDYAVNGGNYTNEPLLNIPTNAKYIAINAYHAYSSSLNYAPIKDVLKEIGSAGKRQLKILSVGNSYSQDALSYVPWLLKGIAPNVDITIGILYYSGCTLQQHLDFFNNESAVYTYYKAGSSSASWSSASSKTIQYGLADEKWDVILLQQGSSASFGAWGTTFAPYLYSLIDNIMGAITYPVKFGWMLTQSRPKVNADIIYSAQEIASHFVTICENARKVMETSACDFIVPVGTAIQNARGTSLATIGDYNDTIHGVQGYLCYSDGAHLQEGLPCQLAAYTFIQSILNVMGMGEKGIMGENTIVNASWTSGKSIPGAHGSCVGSTASNNRLAQKCVQMAIKNPFAVTEIL